MWGAEGAELQREGNKGGCGDRDEHERGAVSGADLSAPEDKSKVKNPKSQNPKSHASEINQRKVGNPTEIPGNITHCAVVNLCNKLRLRV